VGQPYAVELYVIGRTCILSKDGDVSQPGLVGGQHELELWVQRHRVEDGKHAFRGIHVCYQHGILFGQDVLHPGQEEIIDDVLVHRGVGHSRPKHPLVTDVTAIHRDVARAVGIDPAGHGLNESNDGIVVVNFLGPVLQKSRQSTSNHGAGGVILRGVHDPLL
jgi:hypothetical protein